MGPYLGQANLPWRKCWERSANASMQHRGRVNSPLLPLSLVPDREGFVVDDKLHCESILTVIY